MGTNVSLADGVKRFCLRNSGKGILVLISDLMDKTGYETALRFLLARQYDIYVIHLFAPATETIPAQSDSPPRGGEYPTSQWAQGEVVSDEVVIALKDVPAGAYQLAVGIYGPDDAPRLAVRGSDGVVNMPGLTLILWANQFMASGMDMRMTLVIMGIIICISCRLVSWGMPGRMV